MITYGRTLLMRAEEWSKLVCLYSTNMKEFVKWLTNVFLRATGDESAKNRPFPSIDAEKVAFCIRNQLLQVGCSFSFSKKVPK